MLSGQQLRFHLPFLTRKSTLRRYMSFPFWHCTFVTPPVGRYHRPEQHGPAISVGGLCCNGKLAPFWNSCSEFPASPHTSLRRALRTVGFFSAATSVRPGWLLRPERRR